MVKYSNQLLIMSMCLAFINIGCSPMIRDFASVSSDLSISTVGENDSVGSTSEDNRSVQTQDIGNIEEQIAEQNTSDRMTAHIVALCEENKTVPNNRGFKIMPHQQTHKIDLGEDGRIEFFIPENESLISVSQIPENESAGANEKIRFLHVHTDEGDGNIEGDIYVVNSDKMAEIQDGYISSPSSLNTYTSIARVESSVKVKTQKEEGVTYYETTHWMILDNDCNVFKEKEISSIQSV